LLPARFVPCPDRAPLVTPSRASIIAKDDRLSVTFVATGAADVRFCIKRLDVNEKFSDYNLTRLFDKPPESATKATMGINLGIFKIEFSQK
jgi:hypothetical protein